jgi:hypothetical protein
VIEKMVNCHKALYNLNCMNQPRYAKSFPSQLYPSKCILPSPTTTNYGICFIFLKLSNAVVMDL